MRNYELRIETSEMKKALDMLSTVINSKNPLPILGDALCRYDRERRVFTMTAGNGDMWLQTDCTRKTQDGQVEPWMFEDTGNRGDGKREPLEAFCIRISDFREAFANLPSMPAHCYLQTGDEGGQLRVTYNKGEFTLPVEPAGEYPQVPRVVEQGEPGNAQPIVKFTIATQQLLPLIAAARNCTADDELRPVMNAVALDCYHDRLIIAASNGHCLYKRILDTLGAGWLRYGEFPTLDPQTQQSGHAIILLPKQTASPLMKALAQTETITLTADSQRISIEGDGRRLTTASIEGRYPNYDSVIPKDSPHHVTLDRSEIMATLRRISYFSSEASNMGVMRYDGNDHFDLEASDLDFGRKAAEKVAIVNGESIHLPDGFAIGYKISTMLSVLALAQSDNIILDLADPSRAIVIREDEPNSRLTLLCMPMLVNE